MSSSPSEVVCNHEETRVTEDLALADPVTYDFVGRFDVVQCSACFEILSKTPTSHPEPTGMTPPN
jgi:hypothetical protein